MSKLIDTPEQKIEVLGRMYSTVIAEMTEFRSMMIRMLFWASGVLLLIVGWLVSKKSSID